MSSSFCVGFGSASLGAGEGVPFDTGFESLLSDAAMPATMPVGTGSLPAEVSDSESLSGTSFSKLRAEGCGSSFGAGFGSTFVAVLGSSFGSSFLGSSFLGSSFLGSSFLSSSFLGAAAGAGDGAELVLVGVDAMGVLLADVAFVSRSTTLGRAVLPPNHSAAVSAGSIELAGG